MFRWDRAALKQNAKNVLKVNYWGPFIVLLVLGSIAGGVNISTNVNNLDQRFFEELTKEKIMLLIAILAFSAVFTIFVTNPIQVGVNRYFMENRVQGEYAPSISRMFCVFKSGHYLKVVKVMFLMQLKVCLWSLLFYFPGLVKTYEYYMVPYILAENPNLSTSRIFELTKKMTAKDKLEIFILEFSFIGWFLLGTIACGVGVLFVNPYFVATKAELCGALREKVFSTGESDPNELFGFRD